MLRGCVVLVQRADRLRLVVDVELGDEVLQRVGRDRLAGGVARLEQVDDLGVEDLVGLIFGALIEEVRFVSDSPLEGEGFVLSG